MRYVRPSACSLPAIVACVVHLACVSWLVLLRVRPVAVSTVPASRRVLCRPAIAWTADSIPIFVFGVEHSDASVPLRGRGSTAKKTPTTAQWKS